MSLVVKPMVVVKVFFFFLFLRFNILLFCFFVFTKAMYGYLASALTCKDLGSHHSCLYNNNKKLKHKINDTYWTHQRIEIVRQTIPLQSRDR